MEMEPELYQAVISGEHEYLEKFRKTDSLDFPLPTSDHKNTILHVAAKCGRMQIAEKIISLSTSLLHQTNSKGDLALHIAARLGRLEMTQLLINCAKLVEVEDNKELLRMQNLKKDTALHEAVRNGRFEVVATLLSEDPELSRVVNRNGDSPLFIAVDRKWYKIAGHILKASPMCSFGGQHEMNVLHAAIIRADKKFIYEVIRRRPSSISEADNFGWIALHYAAHLGNSEVADLLLDFDVSLAYVKDKEGMSTLHRAAKSGQDDVAKKLVEKCPGGSELLDSKGQTALHVAAQSGHTRVVKTFLSTWILGDLINEKDKQGNTAFHLAALHGHQETLLVLANDPRVNKGAMNNDGFTTFDIIVLSAQFEHHEKVQTLGKFGKRGVLKSLNQAVIRKSTKTNDNETMDQGQPTQAHCQEAHKLAGLHRDGAAEASGEQRNNCQHYKDTGNMDLVVAAIIAAVAFAAAFTAPAGLITYFQDQGMATLSKKSSFRLFVVADSLAFGFSTAAIFLHFGGLGAKSDHLLPYQTRHAYLFNQLSIYALVVAFLAGISVVLGESPGLASVAVAAGCCFFWGPVISLLISFYNLYACYLLE